MVIEVYIDFWRVSLVNSGLVKNRFVVSNWMLYLEVFVKDNGLILFILNFLDYNV